MLPIFAMLLIYFVIKLAVIALGIGVGFLLHWIMPSVELGTSILIGVIATGISIHYFIRFNAFLESFAREAEEEEDEGAPRIVFYPPRTFPPRRRRGRKES